MKKYFSLLVLTSLFLSVSCSDKSTSNNAGAGSVAAVKINGTELSSDDLQKIKTAFGSTPPPADYWYDSTSHLYGLKGNVAAGLIDFQAIGVARNFGAVARDASSGNTGVLINGREISSDEKSALQQLCQLQDIAQAEYTIDSSGNIVTNGAFIGNLQNCIPRNQQKRSPYLGSPIGVGAGGDSSCNWVSIPGSTGTNSFSSSAGCG